ncbi:MAG: SpoIIE family protein phosphatase [Actinomycetota bacterium]|nr:SpoIIE family protein phosphatase [Actinomycetota bacterium]
MADRRANVLIVDDHPENLLTLEAVLEPLGQNLVRASSGEEALQRLLKDDFALILLDVQMPGLDGFETAEYIKRREKTRHIPIIFLTAISKDAEQVFRGYAAGAVDYVFKPFDPLVLRSKVSVFLDLDAKTRALRESEERFRAAFAHAPIGKALVTPEGRISQVNRSLCQLLDRTDQELVGQPIEEVVHRRERSAHREALRGLLEGEAGGHRLETRFVRRDGVPVSVVESLSLVRDAEGRPQNFIVQAEDVTERLRAERERVERLQEQAARAEAEARIETIRKLQTVTDAALSHLELSELCRELLACISKIMTVDSAAVLLLEPDEDVLTVRAAIGSEDEVGRVRVRIGEHFAGRVAAERRPILIPDASRSDVRPSLRRTGVRSLLGVPLLLEDRLLGVLHVGTLEARKFTEDEIGLLRLIAERAALAIEHSRLYEREQGIVETLQRSLLPERLPRLPGLTMAARYLPGGEGMQIGGDWYDAILLDEGRLGVAMGDVVGHGLGAASLMGQLRNALRAYAVEGHSPAGVVARLDRLMETLEHGRMATLLYLEVNPDGARVRFSCAGHPPPLVRGPDGSVTYLEGARSLPLGVTADEPREEEAAELEPGSTLVLYTDGLVEDRERPIDDGLRRLSRAAAEGSPDPEQLCEQLVERLLEGREARDDVAVLAFQTTPIATDRLELELSTDARALSSMRHTLARWLREAGASDAEGREIQFACHEACSNAIEHGFRFREASFDVEALLRDGEVLITVRDSGRWRSPAEGDRGRGLTLMKALMDWVEVESTSSGTTVLMRRELARDGEARTATALRGGAGPDDNGAARADGGARRG